MIKKIRFMLGKQTSPYTNLAIEEYLLHQVEEEECILYLWQNQKTVVIGKNQNCWKECKVEELKENGGSMIRRLSGGGAVFHDLGNLNFTFLVRKNNYDLNKQLEVILKAVLKFGIDVKRSGRNDITVDDRKFSGNAFYTSGDCCYHHGTILLNVDMENLSKYLTVSTEKLQSKGVSSVKSRVVNLTELNPKITKTRMCEKLIQSFGEVYELTPTEILNDWREGELTQLIDKFSSWEWNFGSAIPFTYEVQKRFSWGDIQLQLEINKGIVIQSSVFSDSLEATLIAQIPGSIEGIIFSSKSIAEYIKMISLEEESSKEIINDIVDMVLEQKW